MALGVFRLTTAGELTTLITSAEMVNVLGGGGATLLRGGLLAGSDGALYGVSGAGGTGACASGATVIGCGTVFRVVPGDESPGGTGPGPGPQDPSPPNPGSGGGGGGGGMDVVLPLLAMAMIWMRRRRL